MFQIAQKIILISLALMVSACGATFDYDALRQQNGEGGNFSVELGRAYKKFAISEHDDMVDLIDGAHFGEKAQQAFANQAVAPENVADWRLTKDQQEMFKGARERLVHILDRHSKIQLPKVAAAAQVNFDCWIEQREENWQLDHIAKCRRGFYAAVERLEELASLARSRYLPVANKSQVIPARQTLISPRSVHETRTYTLHFSFDKTAIDKTGKIQIDRVFEAYQAGAPVAILLAGHADRAGKKPYNLDLSRRRSETVRRALIERGIPVQMIAAHAFGETRPKIATADGFKEPANRRVEITIGPAPAL